MSRASGPTASFWRGKRVLVTGHTGFKGAWMALWLQRLGAQVTGIALEPATTPSLFSLLELGKRMESQICDIRRGDELSRLVEEAAPEIVFHMAAQPLVRASYADPVGTMATNVMGTVHVLHALRGVRSVKAVVAVTTDKVYRNLEHPYPYREDDALGGHDPYSASKAASELVVTCYRDAFLAAQGVALASARAGNVIGGGDWSADRLVPDAIRAWGADGLLRIRRPNAVRPWQHVLEPLAGYMMLAEALWAQPTLAGAWNFGPQTNEAASVRTVVELARNAWGPAETVYEDGSEGPHEAGWLALEIAKARTLLNWAPKWSLEKAVLRTVRWYREQLQGSDARLLCEADIAAYEAGA